MTDAGSRFTEVTDIDGVVVVRFHDLGAVVSGCQMDKINNLAGELSSIVERNPVAVILDFEGKFFIPAATIENVLVSLHVKLDDRLRMCNLPEMVTEHFETNRLATLFQIHSGLEDALAAAKDIDREL